MNEFRRQIRDESAYIALETCKIDGEFVRYKDRATSRSLWIWTLPNKETRTASDQGALQEERTARDFYAPRQLCCSCGVDGCDCENKITIFDGELFPDWAEPSSNAIVYFEGFEYALESFKRDAVGAGYTMTMIRPYARRTEIRA